MAILPHSFILNSNYRRFATAEKNWRRERTEKGVAVSSVTSGFLSIPYVNNSLIDFHGELLKIKHSNFVAEVARLPLTLRAIAGVQPNRNSGEFRYEPAPIGTLAGSATRQAR
jgi:hypothetical protein